MIAYKYPNKDKRIDLYSMVIHRDSDNNKVYVKKHFLPKGRLMKAYIVDMVAESNENYIPVPVNRTSFNVNWRRNVDIGMYIDYYGKTYKVIGKDELDYRHTERRLVGETVPAPHYDEERWGTL
jgi:hypothetical protein